MARAETLTKLSLDRWAQIIGISPLHFNGVFVNTPTVCSQPWMQFPHQAVDRVSREDVAYAIAQAEADLEHFLGYRLLPGWEVDEWNPTVRPWKPENFNLSVTGVRGLGQTVRAKWGMMVSGGIRAQEVIQAGAAVTYSDNDGDGYSETATVTIAASVSDVCEYAVFFPAAGPVTTAGAQEWEIRPRQVVISGGLATITLRREQLVLPQLQSDLVPPADDSHLRGVDGADNANFLTTVDIYRVYNDPQRQVQFLWEPGAGGCPSCDGTGCPACSYSAQEGCLLARSDPRLSIMAFEPASWNATTLQFDSAAWAVGRQPDLVRLWYYAGLRDRSLSCPTLQMDREWERIVAYYAAALLDRPVCECNNVHAWVEHWRRDLAISGEEGLEISRRDLDNPFGTRRGMVNAWRRATRDGAAIGSVALA